ncbi:MAG: diacylglycerol kinase family protein [Polyangiaceae bacterium]
MVLAGAALSTHVVINRAARHLREDNALYRMTLAFSGGAEIHETHELGELDEVAQKIAKKGGDKVILCGGDGSYMAGVTALARAFGEDRMPAVALAPGGTVSTVARNWGLAGPIETYAKRLLNAVTEGTATEVRKPTLRVHDDRNGERIGFIFGAGLVANFFEQYNAAPTQGYEGAARIVAKIFAGSFVGSSLAKKILTPVPCTLEIDGAVAEPKAFSLIVASVVKDMGLHLHVAHRAGEEPDRVHLVASPLGPLALGPQMPLVMAGRRLRGPGHVDTLAGKLRVTFDEDRAYVLDGDTLKCRWVDVSAGPQLRLLVP